MLNNFWDKNAGKIVIIYSALLLFILITPMPEITAVGQGKPFDKVVHLALFTMYSIVWMKYFLRSRQSRPVAKSLAISLCFALFTELLQSVVAYRSSEINDFLADLAGILLGGLFARWWLAGGEEVEASRFSS